MSEINDNAIQHLREFITDNLTLTSEEYDKIYKKMQTKYRIPVTVKFKGIVIVKAENKMDAVNMIEKNFGAVRPIYENNNNPKIIDWEMEIHSETEANI